MENMEDEKIFTWNMYGQITLNIINLMNKHHFLDSQVEYN